MSASAAPVVLELPSETGALSLVRAELRRFAAVGVRLAAREIDEVEIALHEACTNAIRHAHRGDAAKRFRVEMRRRDDAIEILVGDAGPPFDLDAVAPPEPESLQEGGYGIAIMRSWMDEVSLSREDGGNVLRLVRRFRGAAGEPDVAAR